MFSFFLDLKLPLRCIYKKNREARDMYVNVENVNFAYDKKPILHDINFGMNKGTSLEQIYMSLIGEGEHYAGVQKTVMCE